MLQLPEQRGEISRALLDALVRDPHTVAAPDASIPADPLSDDDLQLEGRDGRDPGRRVRRRRRRALVGHLALFEIGCGLRRLGCDRETTDFFDEHVTADAVHEAIAAVDLAGGLVRQDPALSADVIWGARALVELEGRFARRLLEAWAETYSSLLGRLVRAGPMRSSVGGGLSP